MADVSYREITYASADGKSTVHAYIWAPTDRRPRAILQLSHGMCEYVRRYDEWARRFVREGFLFCGNDHLGHGASASGESELGFTAARRGAEYLTADVYTLTEWMRAEYPGVPVVLYGHSMGSFVARKYMTQYERDLAGVILSGTAGPGAPTGIARTLAHAIGGVYGDHHRSALLAKLAFGSYTKRFAAENDSASWLSRVGAVRDAYRADPLCTYLFTVGGYDTLFSLLGEVSSKKWANGVRKDLPVLLISGDGDPVGDYGRGVRTVYERLKRAGCDARLSLYAGARHEPHNEENRDEVFADLVRYLEEILK